MVSQEPFGGIAVTPDPRFEELAVFHQEIHRAAHSPRLLTQLRQAAHVVPTNFLTLFPEHEKHSLDEHDQLLDELAAGEPEQARRIAEHHVLAAGRPLASWLADQ
jgi:DNA-binding GntR family transcriptional regulator